MKQLPSSKQGLLRYLDIKSIEQEIYILTQNLPLLPIYETVIAADGIPNQAAIIESDIEGLYNEHVAIVNSLEEANLSFKYFFITEERYDLLTDSAKSFFLPYPYPIKNWK